MQAAGVAWKARREGFTRRQRFDTYTFSGSYTGELPFAIQAGFSEDISEQITLLRSVLSDFGDRISDLSHAWVETSSGKRFMSDLDTGVIPTLKSLDKSK